jgi:hypothetical protein
MLREKVAGGWRRLHIEHLHNLYTLPNIINVIKLRKMRWTGHVTPMWELRNTYKTLVRKQPEGLCCMESY